MKRILPLILVLFIACSKKSKVSQDKVIDVALISNISSIDPAISYDTVSAEVVYQVYEPLYEYEYLTRPLKLKPLLAQSMPDISEDKLTYTFKIKKGIQYHNHPSFEGEKRFVRAQDFILAIKRLAYLPTKANGWWLFDNKVKGLDEFRKKAKTLSDLLSLDVEGLKLIDDYTFRIHLTQPYAQLIYAFSMAFTTPIPFEAVKYSNNNLEELEVGTGPFILGSWDKSLKVTLVKNPDYRQELYPTHGDRVANESGFLKDAGKRLPLVDGVTFHIMKEAQTQWLNFLDKKLDLLVLRKNHFSIVLDPKGDLQERFQGKGINLQAVPSMTYWWLAFNMNDPLVGKNLNLRRAISSAISRKKFVKSFTNNIGLTANSFLPPGIPGYNPSAKLPYSYDVKKAKDYLAKAGYPGGKGLPVIKYDVRGTDTMSRQIGEFVKKELSEVGIKIEVVINSFPAFLNKVRTGQLQFWYGGWGMDYPDPENVVQLLISANVSPGPNYANFKSPIVDAAYEKLKKGVTKGKELNEVLSSVEKVVSEQRPWSMLYYARDYILTHDYLKNLREAKVILNKYKYLRLE